MNITYTCPVCHEGTRSDFNSQTEKLRCIHCGKEISVPADAVVAQQVNRCLVCPGNELFLRKDFPQVVGVGIVVIGFLASSIAWYNYMVGLAFACLFATALIDVLLYFMVPEALVCYRCNAHYRQVEPSKEHAHFDLEVHERYRQETARLGEHSRSDE